MPQHKHPLERTSEQPGTVPDPATPGVTNIGDDAGVFNDPSSATARDHADSTDNGMDPGRSAAIERAEQDENLSPPPADYRPDSIVRATGPDARVEMERGNDFRNEPSFTKGDNAPTVDHSRKPYTVEQMDEYLTEAPRGVFPDTPGGAGATPLSNDRHSFINEMTNLGRFPSTKETEKWSRAVFNALRQHTYEVDDRELMDELKQAVRFGEAPEVQVEEMMWGGNFVERYARMTSLLQNWSKQEFYQQVAEEAHETADDPWVDAAVYSFFGALKRSLGDDASGSIGNLGEFQEIWDRA